MDSPTLMSTSNQNNTPLTEDAGAFLKTATASPDYENLPLEGVPDSYSGPTFVKKDFVYTTVEVAAGETRWFVMTPTAGVAFYEAAQATIDPTLSLPFEYTVGGAGGVFPDSETLFPGVGTASVGNGQVSNSGEIVQGRMVSHSAEIVTTNNAFNQYGTITSFKTPLTRVLAPPNGASTGNTQFHIAGCPALFKNPISSEANVAPVREGSYSVAMSREADFNFYDVLDNYLIGSRANSNQEAKVDSQIGYFQGPAIIWDNGYDSIVFRVTVPADSPASQGFILKIWRVWEFQPAASSLAHSIAHASPTHEPRAIAMYHEMAKNLPVSVPSKDNPDFWNRLLDTVSSTSAVLSGMPVPGVAGAAKGVHAVTKMIDGVRTRTRARRQQRRANGGPKPRRRRARRQNRRKAVREARRNN